MTKPDPIHTRCVRFVLIVLCHILISINLHAQVDSVFWFAAPDVSAGHGDVPIYLRFTTLNEDARITLSQPANSSFQPITFDVEANDSYSLNLNAYKSVIENDIPNVVLDRGLKITSTSLVNVYYENAAHLNPEIFSLKGSKALGKEFLIPMQHIFPNGNYNPLPYASFDIVATQDETTVTIIPKHDIIGHAAGDTFQITLNRGQTFVARAVTQRQGLHLGGSVVLSDKPVAITLKDDSMVSRSIYGGCADLGGDQITPIDFLGKRYISVPGELNGPNDAVFVYAIEDHTEVMINGQSLGLINRTEFVNEFSGGEPMLIESSKPTYVLHMSGFGCEVGLDQLPPVDPCNGSRILSVNRSSNQPFFLNILVYDGLKESFTFNGRSDIIQPSDFEQVSSTNGLWWYANIEMPLSEFAVSEAAIIENTDGPFHLSVIHGGPKSGTMYGYFSDYGSLEILPDVEISCAGGTQLELDSTYATYEWSTGDTTHFISIRETGSYSVTVTSIHGCVASDTIEVEVLPEVRHQLSPTICPSDTFELEGERFHLNHPKGKIVLPGAATNGCDSIIEVNLEFYSVPEDTVIVQLCPDDSTLIAGRWFSHGSQSSRLLLHNASFQGCDSSFFVEVHQLFPTESELRPTICPGESIEIHGQTFDTSRASGTIVLHGQNHTGCDSTIHINLNFYQEPLGTFEQTICHGDSVRIENQWFYPGRASDTMRLSGRSQYGCDSLLAVDIDFHSKNEVSLTPTICPGQHISLHGQTFNEENPSGYITLHNADRHGCDSILNINVGFYQKAHAIVTDTLCPGGSIEVGGQTFSELRNHEQITLPGSSQHGCDSIIDVSLYFPKNELWLQDSHHLGYGKEIQLTPYYLAPFREFEWSDQTSLSCKFCERPWAKPEVYTRYDLKGTDYFGCPYYAHTEVYIFKNKHVFIPNAITINGDGINDGFTAFTNYFSEHLDFIEIYNRWGGLIFRVEDIPPGQPNLGWNGTENGEWAQPGVYAYRVQVRFLDGSTEQLAGDVTVLR